MKKERAADNFYQRKENIRNEFDRLIEAKNTNGKRSTIYLCKKDKKSVGFLVPRILQKKLMVGENAFRVDLLDEIFFSSHQNLEQGGKTLRTGTTQ